MSALALSLSLVAPGISPGGEDAQIGRSLQAVRGVPRLAETGPGDTLVDLAFRYRVGFDQLQRLNPDVKVWIPEPGTLVLLPTRYVLPDAEPKGLVANLPEMRLYDFRAGRDPRVYALAVGDAEDPSPLGEFEVGVKRTDPVWSVPESIRSERPELPRWVAPGPSNPLGSRWMTIGRTAYGLHGTNLPWSIGRMATHGCLRLYDDEARSLYELTPSGTSLEILYQPVKLGASGGWLYIEAHPDIYGRIPNPPRATLSRLRELGLAGTIDTELVRRVVTEGRGFPVRIAPLGELPSATSRPAA